MRVTKLSCLGSGGHHTCTAPRKCQLPRRAVFGGLQSFRRRRPDPSKGPRRAITLTRAHGCCQPVPHSHHLEAEEEAPSWARSVNASLDEEDGCEVRESRIHHVIRKVLGAVGLLQLSELLDEKIWVSGVISALFLAAAALAWIPESQALLASKLRGACIVGIFVLAGIPEVISLLFNITAGCIDTHVLMTLACFGTLAIGSAFEGALLLVLFNVSHTVEHVLTKRAQGNLRNLFDKVPEEAVIVELDNQGAPIISGARRVPAVNISTGSDMLVRPGQQIALDGEIVYGEALVSTEHITGEALPVRRKRGHEVPAGALNHDGILVVRASRSAAQSTPARIARLTQYAQAKKPQLGRWLDTFGEIYARSVIAATVASFLGLLALGVPLLSGPSGRGALYRALGLLTTASPCALVLVPMAYVSAIAAVTHRGILIKGGRVLDALAQCSTIAFDKTGTLTTGNLSCTGLVTPGGPDDLHAGTQQVQHWASQVADRGSAEDVSALSVAIALSERASHPVSKATAALGQEAQLPITQIDDFKLVPGAGVQGTVVRGGSKRHVRFGSVDYAVAELPPAEAALISDSASALMHESVVSLLVETDSPSSSSNSDAGETDSLIRILTFSDMVHGRSAAAVRELQSGAWASGNPKNKSLNVIMLTGDNEASAKRVGRVLGIRNVHANLSPEQKLEAVRAARRDSGRGGDAGMQGVVMVGDGINDAPALATAEVGIAVTATPTEAAASAADVLLLTGEGIAALPFLLRTADRTQAVIKQNLLLAVGAILALSLPVLSGAIPLWVAVGLHEGSTLLVALNCVRLLYSKDKIDIDRRSARSSSQGIAEIPPIAVAA